MVACGNLNNISGLSDTGIFPIHATTVISLSLLPFKPVTTVTSSLTTVSTTFPTKSYLISNNVTWIIQPKVVSNGKLYLSFSYFNIPCISGYLSIYDGPSLDYPLIAKLCGQSIFSNYSTNSVNKQPPIYKWLQLTRPSVALNYVRFKNAQLPTTDNFEISYISDGASVSRN